MFFFAAVPRVGAMRLRRNLGHPVLALDYDEVMRVDVLYFGVLKDWFGGERDSVELPAGASVGDLVGLLKARGVADAKVWGALAVAVNREYAGVGTVLSEGDEVALLPPVSGGCNAR